MFPSGLLEAAREGHKDAIIDLAQYLIDLGDPRGTDILWRVEHDRVTERTLKIATCPRCGSGVWTEKHETNLSPKSCDDVTVVLREGAYELGPDCKWEGTLSDLIPPLIKEEQ